MKPFNSSDFSDSTNSSDFSDSTNSSKKTQRLLSDPKKPYGIIKSLHTPLKFIEKSKLKNYLILKNPNGNFNNRIIFTLNEILQHLKHIISTEVLYDIQNPVIIICDIHLDHALDMAALHLNQIKDQVLKQLENVTNQPLTDKGYIYNFNLKSPGCAERSIIANNTSKR